MKYCTDESQTLQNVVEGMGNVASSNSSELDGGAAVLMAVY